MLTCTKFIRSGKFVASRGFQDIVPDESCEQLYFQEQNKVLPIALPLPIAKVKKSRGKKLKIAGKNRRNQKVSIKETGYPAKS